MTHPHSPSWIVRHLRTLGTLLFLFAYGAAISYATPPTTPYQPGATLDPSCTPGSTNCSVQILPEQSGNTNRLLTTDGTTTSWTNTLTGIALSGATNTLSNIPNSALTNNTITINGAAIALGGSVSNLALTTAPLSQFAATTSAQLAGVLSDETGTGSVVYSASPTLTGTTLAEALTLSGAFINSAPTPAVFANSGPQNYNRIELRGGTGGTAVNWAIEKDNTTGNALQITPSTTNGGTTYTTPVLTVQSNGNVGVGTGVPSTRLNTVVGYVSGTIVPAIKISTVGGYNSGSGTAIDFGQDQDSYSTWVTGRVASPRTANNWGGSLTFSTNDDSGAAVLAERMRITSSGTVGIGTISPGGKVDIVSDVAANGGGYGLKISSDTTNTADFGIYSYGSSYVGGSLYSIGQNGFIIQTPAAMALDIASGSPFIIGHSGTTRLTIDSSGNIVIPDLAGSGNRCVYADSTGQLNVKGFDCGSASGGDNLGDHTATQNVILGTNWLSGDGGNEGIRIDASGNVGVGTGSPGARFEIATSGTQQAIFNNTSSSGGYLTFRKSGVDKGYLQWNYDIAGSVAGDYMLLSNIANGGSIALQTRQSGGTMNQSALVVNGVGNVGVGIATPQYKMQIAGGTNWTVHTTTDFGPGVGSGIFFRTGADTGNTYSEIRALDAGGGAYNNLIMQAFGGKVGIGTASPTEPLSISTATHGLYSQHRPSSGIGVGQAMYYRFNTADGTNAIYTGIYSEIVANTDSAQSGALGLQVMDAGVLRTIVRVNPNGTVGIGNSGNASYRVLATGNVASVDTNGQNTIYLSAGTSASYLAASYIGGGSYVPIVLEVGGAERMRIDQNGNTAFGFNNMGTNNPGYRNMSMGGAGFLYRNASDAYITSNVSYNGSGLWEAKYDTAQGIGLLTMNGGQLSWDTYNGTVTDGGTYSLTNRFTILKSGNVGIGIGNPLYTFQVQAPGTSTSSLEIVSAFRKSSAGGGELGIRVHDSLVDILSTYETTAANVDISFTTTMSNATQPERMRIQASTGNVGIGTTTPYSRLDINGGSIRMGESLNNASSYIGKQSSGNSIFYSSLQFYSTTGEDALIFNTHLSGVSAGERMRITGGGNVGIGTTNPLVKLKVSGDIESSGMLRGTGWITGTGTGPGAEVGVSSGYSYFFGYDRTAGVYVPTRLVGSTIDLRINDATSGLFVNGSGSVGIGNPSSIDAPLHVNGGPVMTSGWNRTQTLQATFPTLVFNSNATRWAGIGYDYSATTTGMNFWLYSNTSDITGGSSTALLNLRNDGIVRFPTYGAGTLTTDASGNITASSDERLKDIEGEFIRGLAEVRGIDTVLYRWNALSGYDTEATYAGFIAQNIQSLIPEAVGEDSRGYLTLNDRPILAAAINAIKELDITVSAIPTFEDQTLYAKIATFLEGIANGVADITRVRTSELCVDDVCVTRDQFLQMIQQSGAAQSSGATDDSSSDEPIPDTSEEGGTTEEQAPQPEDGTPEEVSEPESIPGGEQPEPIDQEVQT